MRKIFLISLLALFTCATAWAGNVHVSDIAGLRSAIANANVEIIYLDADIAYADETQGNQLNIARSLTIDGQGHTLSGYGKRTSSVYNIFSINNGGGSAMVDVVFKNLNMIITKATKSNDRLARVIETRGNIKSIELNNVTIGVADHTKTNAVGLQLGGSQASKAILIITNSIINVGNPGYPVLSWNPYEMTATNSEFAGYCGLYFKGVNGSAGSRGSIVNATNCNFECPNVYSGATNAFSCFPIADDGITLNLHNCGINNQQIGDQNQALVTIGNDGLGTNRHAQAININISGDNSHINVGGGMNKTFQNLWGYGTNGYPNKSYNDFADINVTITGGTYSVHPQSYDMAAYGHWIIEEEEITSVELIIPEIPEGYDVQEVNQSGITLYRIVKKAATKEVEDPVTGETVEVLYDLNDLVEGEGVEEGNNPVSSFELSTGEEMTLNQETTTAGYVQVQDNVTVNPDTQEEVVTPTTVQVGKTEVNPETEEKEKVDQTLVINNGLDVQGDSKVEVQAGSALVIGEGGINTEKPENIVIEADEQGAASLLLEPSITVNQTPELTVKMTVPAEHAGYEMFGGNKYRHWFRFAVPVKDGDSWTKEPNVPTYLYGWDYNEQEWAQVSVAEMIPFYGYTLSPDQEIDGTTAVTYTFKGKLMGNTDCKLELNHHGYNFFGNSYTGYISILKLVEQIMGDAKIDGTVWMWDGEKYQGVALAGLSERPYLYADWQKEVAPMQTFVLRLTGAEFSSTDINYADAIWGNPRYSSAVANAAPARKAEMNDNAIIRMTIAANGQKESVLFIENNDYSDEYDRGYDAIKYMNGNSFNSYVSVNGENYGTVATDNIEGKMLDIRTSDAYAYSMTFDFVAGEEYALLDNATKEVIAIEEGNTYEFAAQPNSIVEGRFEIISRAKMPTAIENTEVKADVKGIYTIMGQYLGENFEALPAGVYVVNGVKIVK